MNKKLNRLKSVRQGYGLKIEQVCRWLSHTKIGNNENTI
ncbi:hypothetical protein SAMN04489758_11534 [Thomasclavelia cocleata]|jgi:hypothetical protein|uniref:Uncharacterized protein n=1 Tax=Thomasclavelia cocleata TaxID=69824 RepID=A0A1I0EYQ2_9FIRM|nr:hypothetical protein IMSAGC017_00287 [Thomasclavelia cocleata]SET50671.1 hypothetical protein SAMN04489758_11534 [Thomasclavelia cocleata]